MFVKKHNQSVMIDKLEKNIPPWLESATVRQFGDKARDRYSEGLLKGECFGSDRFYPASSPTLITPIAQLRHGLDIARGC